MMMAQIDVNSPPASDATARYREAYASCCRPLLADRLAALKLDKCYHRASGDQLYYFDEHGHEIAVLDFVGGYGASLFGHHHPALAAVAFSNLQHQVPFNVQGSCRTAAGALGQKLDAMLHARTGRHFVTTLASTGAEAVEVAIKHAELALRRRLDEAREEAERSFADLSTRTASSRFLADVAGQIGRRPRDLADALAGLHEHNTRVFATRSLLLAVNGGFHGKTSGALQLTANPEVREPFAGIGPDTAFLDPQDVEALTRWLAAAKLEYCTVRDSGDGLDLAVLSVNRISALLVEPLQGEGGVRPLSADFLERARDAADRNGFALVFDEIQSGMGRTGTFLYAEQTGVTADYYLLSKSLGGGLAKIAAVAVCRDHYVDEFGLLHTSTFAEDEHSARIACAALDIVDGNHDLLNRCRERGGQLRKELLALQRRHPDVIADVRGVGLMLGVELRVPEHCPSDLLRGLAQDDLLGYAFASYLLHEHRLRVLPSLSSPTTLRLQPSAYVSADDCSRAVSALDALAAAISAGDLFRLTRYVLHDSQHREDHGEPATQRSCRTRTARPIADADVVGRVGFVAHFIEPQHVALRDPSLAVLNRQECEIYLDRVHRFIGPATYEQTRLRSATGEALDFTFVGLPMTSRHFAEALRQRQLKPLRARVQEGVDLAAAHDCEVVGLGGFTSIVTNNCRSLRPGSTGLTSGNALTIGMAIEATLHETCKRGIELSTARLAAVGAAGNIGSLYCELMAQRVRQVLLVGRPDAHASSQRRLEATAAHLCGQALRTIRARGDAAAQVGVAAGLLGTRALARFLAAGGPTHGEGERFYHAILEELGEKAPVRVAEGPAVLQQADVILGASSSPDILIRPHHLGPQPVVICDLSTPPDTDPAVSTRSDVSVIGGGLVQLPADPDFAIGGVALPPGIIYACMAETMILGLAGLRGHFSYGSVSRAQVEKISALARLHGFELARGKDVWGNEK